MPLNSNIPLSFQFPKIEGPLDQYGKLAELAGVLQQQQAGQMKMQEAQRQAEQMQAYRAGLRPDMTPEQRVAHAAKFVTDPKDVLHYEGQQLTSREAAKDRALQFSMTLQQRQDSLDEKKREFESKTTDQRARDQFEQWYKGESLKNQQAYRAMEISLRQQGIDLRRDLATTANKPPSGYRPTAEGNLEAIPGGPADLKIQGQLNQDTANFNSIKSSMDRLERDSNALLTHPGLEKSTGLRSIVPGIGGIATIPGTDAANFKADLENLKSQAGFAVLQAMRDASKTGGALGQVSDFENKMLQANLASLDRAKSAEEFKASLKRIIQYSQGASDRLRKAYNMKHGDKGLTPATPSPQSVLDQADAILKGK